MFLAAKYTKRFSFYILCQKKNISFVHTVIKQGHTVQRSEVHKEEIVRQTENRQYTIRISIKTVKNQKEIPKN